jgi:DNA-binding NarL/FixJ family response regulator
VIRVLIVDDHQLVRQGIAALLENDDEVSVVGQASSGDEALRLLRKAEVDVVVLDISMPGMDGITTIQHILEQSPDNRVLALSMHSDIILVKQMLRAGARGYVLKNSAVEELRLAIRAAYNDHMYISPALSATLFDALRRADDDGDQFIDPLEQITAREREVLQLLAEGSTNKTIGETLNISPKTVEKHRKSLMDKLGAGDFAGLIRLAIKHNLIVVDH